MTIYKVGYFVGSLSSTSINRLLAKALVPLAPPELVLSEIAIRDLPLYSPDYDADYPPVARAFKQAIADVDAYATPLGTVPVDTELRATLVRESLILMSTAGHGEEHALEVQLPFLQCTLGEFSLLPLVIGNQSRQECFALGKILGMVLKGSSVLLVASTDLSHFHTAATATRLDDIVAADLAAFDAEQLMSDLESGRAEACGGGPAVAVMVACHRLGARTLRVVHRTHSGEITGANSGVVGYLSAIIQLPGTAPA